MLKPHRHIEPEQSAATGDEPIDGVDCCQSDARLATYVNHQIHGVLRENVQSLTHHGSFCLNRFGVFRDVALDEPFERALDIRPMAEPGERGDLGEG